MWGVNYLNPSMALFQSERGLLQREALITESSVTQSAYFWPAGGTG